MQVRWRKRALADLDRFHQWLSAIDDAQPDRVILRIRTAADLMTRLGDIGRPGLKSGTRELSVRSAPYVIVYRVAADTIDILAVYHTAQMRPPP